MTGAVVWKYFDSRHKQRMAIIEKGMSPSDFKELTRSEGFQIHPLSNLKWGMVAVFIGLGMMLGTVIEPLPNFHDAAYPMSIFIMGGLALIFFYFIAASKAKKEEEKQKDA